MPLKCRHASRSLILILTVLIVVAAWTADAFAGGKGGGGGVKGYNRKDGTPVAPHRRSPPDSSPYNNYEMPGNYNPNKGTITPGNPDNYRDRYYEKKGG